ncbi:cobalamin B12-binding domain-containing protein [Hoeflea sp. AS60]|uniref:cobalamin B12-binding domain-containing protein n=1 Tax=Hoeflea sp. AS60 TaxID=3135780 RepID=UPI00317B00F3
MSDNEESGGYEQSAPSRHFSRRPPAGSAARSTLLSGIASATRTMKTEDRGKLEEAIRHHFHYESSDTAEADQQAMDGTVYFGQFLSAILEKDPKHFRIGLERLRSERVPLLVICETLVIPIAEELGRMWCEDEQSFASVTAATARLQLLLTSLSDVGGPSFCDEDRPRILLMRMPSNDHTLGLSVIASVFHEEGWSVDGGPSLQAGNQAYGMVRDGGYQMIGVSVAVGSSTQDVSSVIKKIRSACLTPSLSILVGGPSLASREAELYANGADVVALDVRQAIQMANQIIKSLDR